MRPGKSLMRRLLIALSLGTLLAVSGGSDRASAGFSPTVQRVSVSTTGREANFAVFFPDISANGRFVAFQSNANTLIGADADGDTDCDIGPCDLDNNTDIFVRDRDMDKNGVLDEPGTVSTSLVSVLSDGAQTHADHFRPPAINADGRFVAFTSDHAKLADPNDQPCFGGLQDTSCRHGYRRDRDADGDGKFDEPHDGMGLPETRNIRVSVSHDGSMVDGYSYESAIDASGRYVAFLSDATNIVPGDNNGRTDVFVRDLQQNSTVRVSVSSAGSEANGSSILDNLAISGNGRYVAFKSFATNLVAEDMNTNCELDGDPQLENCPDVFVRDLQSGSTSLVSVSTGGIQGDGASGSPDISADGRYVAFESFASNLVAGDTNENCMFNGSVENCPDIFVRDLQANTTVRVSVDTGGIEGNRASSQPSISGDGRLVSFSSDAFNLVGTFVDADGDTVCDPGNGCDTNGVADVFVRDRDVDADGDFDESGPASTIIASVDGLGQFGSGPTRDNAIAQDGRQLALQSGARLVPEDTNSGGNSDDIYGQDITDIDDDGVYNATEIVCGSHPQNPTRRPERIDVQFVGADDDGDTAIDEALPSGSEDFDCDGDGWTGRQESLIFGDAPSTVRDQDPCGSNGWPAELAGNDNRLNIGDVNSFTMPPRPAGDEGVGGSTFNMFNHQLDDDGDTAIESNEDPGDPGGAAYNIARWNLQLPPHLASTKIDIGDVNAINPAVISPMSRPPMFGGQPAFFTNGGVCPWQPGSGGMAGPMGGGSGESIDQVSIDTGPPGPARALASNGKPAVGDRAVGGEPGDGVPDAEGYDGDLSGTCGNDVDDDASDADGDTVPETFDGVADDGCRVPLTARETCINIIDDGVKNADEDTADRAMIDITVGLPSVLGGGIPSSRPMSAWQYTLEWDVDVLDVRAQDSSFLVLAAGGAQPFTLVADAVPDATSPFTAGVSDAGPGETGPGVLSRVTLEGNGAGIANLALTGVTVQDTQNASIPIDGINGARIAVSKDLDGDGVIEALGDLGQEAFVCAPP